MISSASNEGDDGNDHNQNEGDFEFSVFASKLESSLDCKQYKLSVKINYVGDKDASGMIIASIRLPTGFQPDEESIRSLRNDLDVDLRRFEIHENKVNLYFEELVKNVEKDFEFQVNKIYDVQNTKPGLISVYDYYEPMDEAITQQFEIANECN